MGFKAGDHPSDEQKEIIKSVDAASETMFAAFDKIASDNFIAPSEMREYVNHAIGADAALAYSDWIDQMGDSDV